MIHAATLRKLIRESLAPLPAAALSESAVELLVLTHAHEGTYWRGARPPLTCLWQLGDGLQPRGPALGLYQMEPVTHEDCWNNWLPYHPEWIVGPLYRQDPSALVWNLAYATAMARVYYYRAPARLPAAEDAPGLAAYWHRWWCRGCQGTAAEALGHYLAFTGRALDDGIETA